MASQHINLFQTDFVQRQVGSPSKMQVFVPARLAVANNKQSSSHTGFIPFSTNILFNPRLADGWGSVSGTAYPAIWHLNCRHCPTMEE
jgi:hypothetical protein